MTSLESLVDTPTNSSTKHLTPSVLHRTPVAIEPQCLDTAFNDCIGDAAHRRCVPKTEQERQELVRKRIKEKYGCRFLDGEAANGDLDDSDEEDTLTRTGDDEFSW